VLSLPDPSPLIIPLQRHEGVLPNAVTAEAAARHQNPGCQTARAVCSTKVERSLCAQGK
jgi:hypothetical protein